MAFNEGVFLFLKLQLQGAFVDWQAEGPRMTAGYICN